MKRSRIYKRFRDPVKKDLRTPKYRPRVVHPKKIYNRNKLKKVEIQDEDS